MRIIALAAFVAVVATPAYADVTVGSTDSGNCYPFSCNDKGAIDYYEIYSSTAFSGVTSFDTITFQQWPSYPGFMLSGNYQISFATTTAALNTDPSGSLSNVASFFNGSLAPSQFSIMGSAYTYDPSWGNLVMHVVTTGQPLDPNPGTGYLYADYTGATVSRSYTLSDGTTFSGNGALVTTFSSNAPEPASWALMLGGFGLVGGAMRARRKTAVSFG